MQSTFKIPCIYSVSLSSKGIDNAKLQFRASAFNIANHPVFAGPNTTVGNASFGRIAAQNNLSRQIEFAMKIVF